MNYGLMFPLFFCIENYKCSFCMRLFVNQHAKKEKRKEGQQMIENQRK